MKTISVGYGAVQPVNIGAGLPLVFIGGPCAIETREHALKMADLIGAICRRVGIPWIYKSCFDKESSTSPS